MSRDTMQPLCDAKYTAISKVKSTDDEEEKENWKKEAAKLTKEIKEETALAKAKWSKSIGEGVNEIKEDPKEAWKLMRICEDGVAGHHVKPINMKMMMENGGLANRDKENLKVFEKHLQKIYNTEREVDPQAANLIRQRERMTEMGDEISWSEFCKATMKLKNDKSPGENGVPPNAFKCLDSNNKSTVYKFICDFWNDKCDYEEWHTGIVKLLPKSGDLSNPNKWRGITLMDVCSKILSSILADRAQRLLDKVGIKQQFGGMAAKGCADAQFTLKSLLHLRHQHNLPSYVMYVDLVKAYDTVNHELLFDILEKYGAHPKYIDCVRRMYKDLIAKITVDKEKTEIGQTVGVRHDDNLSPVLFLFVMSAFAESFDDVLEAIEVEKPKC